MMEVENGGVKEGTEQENGEDQAKTDVPMKDVDAANEDSQETKDTNEDSQDSKDPNEDSQETKDSQDSKDPNKDSQETQVTNEDSQEAKDPNKDSQDTQDPYAYTKRDEFTSENFKIEVRGLPRYYPIGQLKKLLNETLQLDAHKFKPAGRGKNWAYVTFKDEKARQKALIVLDKYKWKKCTLTSSVANPVEDPLIKQRGELEARIKKPGPNDHLPIAERIVKSVTPYAHMPYEEQLKEKEKVALNVMRKFGSELGRVNPVLSDWVHWHKLRRKGQVCEMDPILPSPVTEAYRNKCEFSIGINTETQLPTVGFRLSSYREGSMCVAPVENLRLLPDTMKNVVKEFENFIRSTSYAPFSPLTHEGVWRQLTVRTTRNDDILVIVLVHPQQMDEEELGALKKSITDFFTEGSGKELGVTSLFFQAYGQKERGVEEKYEHLWGEETITETILDKKFRVSPDAFLQANTAASEVLYETIGDMADLDGTSVLLDVCCGTGTIGISLAERCVKVYGVEMVKQAADDARFNAEQNDTKNIVIFEGKAEDHVRTLVESCESYDTVGVVDPPRAGLHTDVVCGLRRCENLNRLVYVSCDPTNAYSNFINLGRNKSKTYKGEFFVPIKAVPIDLFPHTPHFELVILFERWNDLKWRRIMKGDPLPKDVEYFKRIPNAPANKNKDKEGKDKPAKEKQTVDPVTGFGTWSVVTKPKAPSNPSRSSNKARHHPYSRAEYQSGNKRRQYREPKGYNNYERGGYGNYESGDYDEYGGGYDEYEPMGHDQQLMGHDYHEPMGHDDQQPGGYDDYGMDEDYSVSQGYNQFFTSDTGPPPNSSHSSGLGSTSKSSNSYNFGSGLGSGYSSEVGSGYKSGSLTGYNSEPFSSYKPGSLSSFMSGSYSGYQTLPLSSYNPRSESTYNTGSNEYSGPGYNSGQGYYSSSVPPPPPPE